MFLLGGVSTLPEKLGENCTIIITLRGGEISVTFCCDIEEVYKGACGHGPDPGSLDERYERSRVMVVGKLD